jgi:hypothetical protein
MVSVTFVTTAIACPLDVETAWVDTVGEDAAAELRISFKISVVVMCGTSSDAAKMIVRWSVVEEAPVADEMGSGARKASRGAIVQVRDWQKAG